MSVEIYTRRDIPEHVIEESMNLISMDGNRLEMEKHAVTQELINVNHYIMELIEYGRDFFFVAYDDGGEYIGIAHLMLEEDVCLSAICKSTIGLKSEIKINSLIIPKICDFLRDRSIPSFRVVPYRRESKILQKHYGFQRWNGYKDILIKYV
jgi:hypothetical protein